LRLYLEFLDKPELEFYFFQKNIFQMGARVIIVVVVFALLYFMRYAFIELLRASNCQSCNGTGYWEGTRGERNRCDKCNGSGKNS